MIGINGIIIRNGVKGNGNHKMLHLSLIWNQCKLDEKRLVKDEVWNSDFVFNNSLLLKF